MPSRFEIEGNEGLLLSSELGEWDDRDDCGGG